MAEHSITGIVAEGNYKGERVWIYWSPEGGGWWQWGPFGWRERFSSLDDPRFKDALACAKGEGWSNGTCGPWDRMADLATIEVQVNETAPSSSKLTDEQDHLLMCAIENLRSADRNDRTVEAAWRMAEKLEAWRKASAAAHAAEISGSNIVRTCEACEG